MALALPISVVSSASLSSVFTRVTPVLENATRISPCGVTLMLSFSGIGLTPGDVLGGDLPADWKLMPSAIGLFTALVPVLYLLTWPDRLPRPPLHFHPQGAFDDTPIRSFGHAE